MATGSFVESKIESFKKLCGSGNLELSEQDSNILDIIKDIKSYQSSFYDGVIPAGGYAKQIFNSVGYFAGELASCAKLLANPSKLFDHARDLVRIYDSKYIEDFTQAVIQDRDNSENINELKLYHREFLRRWDGPYNAADAISYAEKFSKLYLSNNNRSDDECLNLAKDVISKIRIKSTFSKKMYKNAEIALNFPQLADKISPDPRYFIGTSYGEIESKLLNLREYQGKLTGETKRASYEIICRQAHNWIKAHKDYGYEVFDKAASDIKKFVKDEYMPMTIGGKVAHSLGIRPLVKVKLQHDQASLAKF
jgi:hypothetical protein